MASGFSERCKIKKQLNARLKADGSWDAYNRLRAFLKASGIGEDFAWRVAAFLFPPRDQSPAEILADPRYSEIAAGWKNKTYPTPETPQEFEKFPSGATNFDKLKDIDPNAWKADWEKLAAQVGTRTASELEETRWVAANYLFSVKQIKAADVPSTAALSILMWTQMSPSNFGDFLRTNHSKLLPDKRALEDQNRFMDDGRDLMLLDEFEASLELEESRAGAGEPLESEEIASVSPGN